eukprot:XP_001691296.1 predicted protein [Chlamydomonas reinhardtii]
MQCMGRCVCMSAGVWRKLLKHARAWAILKSLKLPGTPGAIPDRIIASPGGCSEEPLRMGNVLSQLDVGKQGLRNCSKGGGRATPCVRMCMRGPRALRDVRLWQFLLFRCRAPRTPPPSAASPRHASPPSGSRTPRPATSPPATGPSRWARWGKRRAAAAPLPVQAVQSSVIPPVLQGRDYLAVALKPLISDQLGQPLARSSVGGLRHAGRGRRRHVPRAVPEAVGEGAPRRVQLRVDGQARESVGAARLQQALGQHDGLLMLLPAHLGPKPVQELRKGKRR